MQIIYTVICYHANEKNMKLFVLESTNSMKLHAVMFSINQSINLFASDHMDPYHNKRKYNEMIK